MAWNEPGGGKQRDPWRDNGNDGPKNDIDAAVQRLKDLFGRLFGGGGGSGRGSASGDGGFGGMLLAVIGIAIAWLLFDSFTSIRANEAGVVLRFGQVTRVMPSGLNFKWPRPVETVIKVDATSVRSASDSVRMLTRDENIVQVNFEVQYLVADPVKFLFSTRDPDATLKQAAESAVREVIGAGKLDAIMPDQRVEPAEGEEAVPAVDLAAQAKAVIQVTLDRYDAGLTVSTLNFQNVRPPQEVKEAFDDAISAREDRQRASNIADAYAKRVVPESRGEAARILAEAEGYKAERIARAEGDAERFGLIVAEYRAAPEVTRKRLYLETMQQVVNRNAKVVDMTDGKNVLYLPTPGTATPPPAPPQAVLPEPAPPARAESVRGGR